MPHGKLRLNSMKMLAASLILFTACTDDASFSDPVSVELAVTSNDVDRGMIIRDQPMATAYATFVNNAQFELQAAPTAIDVTRAQLRLDQSSVNVGELPDVFAQNIEVDFLIDDSDHTVPVALGTISPALIGPVELDVVFDSDTLDIVDYDRLLHGNFKVIVVGRANPLFQIKSATANLEATFELAAIAEAPDEE